VDYEHKHKFRMGKYIKLRKIIEITIVKIKIIINLYDCYSNGIITNSNNVKEYMQIYNFFIMVIHGK
jgi:hypothetical protein